MKMIKKTNVLVLLASLSMSFPVGCEFSRSIDSGPMDSGLVEQESQGKIFTSLEPANPEGEEQGLQLPDSQYPEPPGVQMPKDQSGSEQGIEIPAKPGEESNFAFSHVDRQVVDHLKSARDLLSRKDAAGAILELEKALYDDPSDYDSALLLGNVARRSKRMELATDAYMLCAQLEPDSPEPWLGMARLSLAQKQIDQAEQLAIRALDLKPGNAEANNLLGRIWLKRSHWQKAISFLRKAVELNPENIFYSNNLGFAYLLSRDFQSAVEILEPMANQPEVRAFMVNNLGLAYEGMGRLQDARMMFEKALQKKPGYVNAKVNLERMVQVAKQDSLTSSEEELEQADDMGTDEKTEDLILGDDDE